MDRCLINLLLEQVKHGNRLGKTFISQAWNDMITSFNERFNSQYDKDVLKNRYKHLRKQFNDVDHLLQHGGFSWDDTREMIDAEDHVWDSYTKVPFSTLIRFLVTYCSTIKLTYNSCRHTLKLDHLELNPCLTMGNCVSYLEQKVLIQNISILAHNAHLCIELPKLIAGLFFTLLATVRHYLGQHRLVD